MPTLQMPDLHRRRIFRRRGSSSSSEPILDEEEQEQVISTIRDQDLRSNKIYQTIFFFMPILGMLIIGSSITMSSRRLCVLFGLSSLACTAAIWKILPPDKKRDGVLTIGPAASPLECFLVPLNFVLAFLLLVMALMRGRVDEELWIDVMPAFMLGITLYARQQLVPVDLDDLRSRQYDHRGA